LGREEAGGGRDFIGVYATGRTWETEVKRVRRDDLLRRAAALLDHGDPQEDADVVTFRAGCRASYITGSVIRIDGGLIQSI
jgi:3-oxoacyl-[acyl-carrier protein] reductase